MVHCFVSWGTGGGLATWKSTSTAAFEKIARKRLGSSDKNWSSIFTHCTGGKASEAEVGKSTTMSTIYANPCGRKRSLSSMWESVAVDHALGESHLDLPLF